LNDRAFDLILLSDWEDQIRTDPWSISNVARSENSLTTPINKVLESGAWTQSIIWTPGAPFRDFTQIEFNHEDDIIPEEKPGKPSISFASCNSLLNIWTADVVRPRKRMRLDGHQVKDKFNLSNDHLYEVAKDKLRVRQTFGQLIVEHARPATKLQLPFVSVANTILVFCCSQWQFQYKTRLAKQEARAFHRPALQFPLNIEFKFSKVRKAKKKDKNGKKVAKGGNPSERLQKTADLTLKDSANFVLLEYSVSCPALRNRSLAFNRFYF
jgi:transcription initiation factor TFIID subunit 1, fungi type